MGGRDLDIMILSAQGLHNVKHISKMDVYVVVKQSGADSKSVIKTHVEKDGGMNPTWNFPVQFSIDEVSARKNNEELIFQVYCDRTHRGDKEIGEVRISLKELLDTCGESKSIKVVSYHIKQPDGKSKGELKISYKFGEKVVDAVAYREDSLIISYPPVGFPQTSDKPPVGYPTNVVDPEPGKEQSGFEVVQPDRTNEIDVGALVGILGGLLSGELDIEDLRHQLVEDDVPDSDKGMKTTARAAR